MATQTVRFDESPRSSLSAKPVGPDGVAATLRSIAQASGLDATSELYNRAVLLSQDYSFAEAQRTLWLLLSLDPTDADAYLLLAKVQTGLRQYADALESLAQARTHGANPPDDLRVRIEECLTAERGGTTERTAAMEAREEGEIVALRQEARRLRSENARLVGKAHDLGNEVRRWAWITTGVASTATLFIVINLLIGARPPALDAAPTAATSVPEQTTKPVAAPVAAPQAPAAATAAVAPTPSPSAAAQRAQAALNTANGLDGAALELTVQGNRAVLAGTVETARQRRRAQEVVEGVSGISSVDVAKVNVLARTKGTEHTVKGGDNLSAIALHYYGDSSLAPTILNANSRTLGGKPNLQVGMKLRIPAVE